VFTHKLALIINNYLVEPQASLLNGIIFGINLNAKTMFYQQLKTVGLLHLVVFSGMNISLLSLLVSYFTAKISKSVSLLITIFVIILFTFIVGFQAPVIRASFTAIFTSVGILLGRKNINFFGLFFSFIFICIFFPQWPKSISFQLSYGATIGLLLFAGNTGNNYFFDELKTSLAAQIFTVPLIFFYFKEISTVALIANLLVSWTIAPLMLLGLLTVILGQLNYSLGWLPAQLCYGLLSYIVFVVETLSHLPFALIKFYG
jgi:competence protein ComEC